MADPQTNHSDRKHNRSHSERDLGPQVYTLMQSLQETIIANNNRRASATLESDASSPRSYYESYHPSPSQSRSVSPIHSVEDLLVTAGNHHERADSRTPTLERVGSEGHIRPFSPISYHDKPLDDQPELVENREGFFDMAVFDVTSQGNSARQAAFFIGDSQPDSPITESESNRPSSPSKMSRQSSHRTESDRPSSPSKMSRRSSHRTESEDERLSSTNKNRRSRSRRIPADLSLTTIPSEPPAPAPAPVPVPVHAATQPLLTPSPSPSLTQNEKNDTSLSGSQLQQQLQQQPNTSTSNTVTQTSESTPSTPSPHPSFLAVLLSSLLAHVRETLPPRVQHRLHKIVLAWFFTMLICLITPVQQWVGPVPYLGSTAIVFFHPARTLGAQIEATFMGMLGTVAGMLLSWAGLAASVAFNNLYLQSGNKGGRGIMAAFLFFSIFVITWIRGKYPRFFLFSIMTSILVTFAFTKSVDPTVFSVGSTLDFARPLFIGAVLSLFINLTIWRESASQGLGRALNESLTEIRILLDLTTSAFLLDPARLNLPKSAIDDANSRMRLALAKVLSAYSEARYEVSYGYARPTDFKGIKRHVSKLTQHLGSLALSLQNEKFLLEAKRASLAAPEGLRALGKMGKETEEDEDEEWENQNHEKEMARKAVMMVNSLRARGDKEEEEDCGEESPRPGMVRPNRSERSTPHRRSTSDSVQENNEGEEDEEENLHQTTVHSIRSMLSLSRLFRGLDSPGAEDNTPTTRLRSGTSTPKWLPVEHQAIPPKPTKEIYYGDRELLIKYLTGVKDPLVELTTACEETLEAVRKELGEVLDIDADLIAGGVNKENKVEREKGKEKQKEGERAKEKKKGWLASFWPLTRGQGRTALGSTTTSISTAPPASLHSTPVPTSMLPADRSQPLFRRPLPDYARQISAAVISFDLHEQVHLERLRCDPAFQAGLDLGPREELFLVFFFMFSLREVARELRNLAEGLRTLKAKNGMVEETTDEAEGPQGQGASRMKRNRRKKKKVFLPKINFRKWIKDSSHSTALDRGGNSAVHFDNDTDSRNSQPRYGDVDINPTYNVSQAQNSQSSQSLDPNPEEAARHPVIHRLTTPPTTKTIFPANPDLDTESQAPPKPPLSIRIRYNIWRNLHKLNAYEIKFGLKMAVVITAVSSLAYFDATMDQFALDRGQWAIISILIVMNPTVGGSVNTGFARVVGTVAGALWGMAAWAINGPNPYVLAVMGLILGYPLWYIFLTSAYTKIGSVGIIAYVVVTLSVYTNPDSSDSVLSLAWKRTLTIIIGVLVALFLNWAVWPFVARHQLRKHVGRNIYELGELYSMIITTYVSLSGNGSTGPTEEEVKQLEKMEKKMQVYILKCNELLNLTKHEPRLKGPFPVKIWKEVISSVQNLLDRLVSLKSAAKFISPDIQSELTGALRIYRRDVSAAVILYFHILAGSLISKTPLPPYFPSARIARIRLINRIRQLSDVLPLTGKAGLEYRNLYWYAYMSCMEEIIEELENLCLLVKLITGEPTTLHGRPASFDRGNLTMAGSDEEEEEAISPLDERTAVHRVGRLGRSHVQWESDEHVTQGP